MTLTMAGPAFINEITTTWLWVGVGVGVRLGVGLGVGLGLGVGVGLHQRGTSACMPGRGRVGVG
jgi:hypothetical protein